jgi:hypothetical protein
VTSLQRHYPDAVTDFQAAFLLSGKQSPWFSNLTRAKAAKGTVQYKLFTFYLIISMFTRYTLRMVSGDFDKIAADVGGITPHA